MRLILLASLALLTTLSAPLRADVVTMPEADGPAVAVDKPAKGTTKTAVLRRYGAPTTKHAAVGGDHPQHPPITRWDYPGFVVFFEHDHVVNAVVPGQPPAIQHIEELKSATP